MMGAAADGATGGAPAGPTGPPTNGSVYNAGTEESPLTGVQWTNGDVTANTGYGHSNSPSVDPTGNFGSVAPGITSVNTEDFDASKQWYVRHQKNGQNTVWVLCGGGIGE